MYVTLAFAWLVCEQDRQRGGGDAVAVMTILVVAARAPQAMPACLWLCDPFCGKVLLRVALMQLLPADGVTGCD